MKQQQVYPDDSLDSLLRSNDPTTGLLEREFRGSSLLIRAPSLGSKAKDPQEAAFVASLMDECGDELVKNNESLSIMRSTDSASYVMATMMRSNNGPFHTNGESLPLPLPLPSSSSAKFRRSTSAILRDDLQLFSSRDWAPLDDCEDLKKIDDALVAHFFESQPANKEVKLFLSSSYAPTKTKTDWNSYYEGGLPPAVPSASVLDPTPVVAAVLPEPKRVIGPPTQTTEKPKKREATKKRQRKIHEPDCKVYVKPTNVDVLFGRGGRSNHHAGNMHYHGFKLKIQPRYMASTKEEKTHVSQELVDMIHDRGGRFLKRDNDAELDKDEHLWYEVLNITARKKVSQALREINTAEIRRQRRARYIHPK